MKTLTLTITLLIASTLFSQNKKVGTFKVRKPKTDMPVDYSFSEESSEVFTIVEKMPEFVGGQEAMNNFLRSNLKYPESAKAAGISGTVYTSFIIRKDGTVTDITVLRGVNEALDNEARRIIEIMVKWNPGSTRGTPVDVHYRLPIKFMLN